MPNSDQVVAFFYEGVAQLNDIVVDGIKIQNTVKITYIEINAREAPVGATLQITLTKNALPSSAIASLASGSYYQATNITDLTFDSTDAIGLKITQIGSGGTEGVGLTITVHYEKLS